MENITPYPSLNLLSMWYITYLLPVKAQIAHNQTPFVFVFLTNKYVKTEHNRRSSEACKFRLGQKIEGRYRGKGRWYKGRIVGTNPDGTYDVRYEDGDEDLRLETSALKSADDENTSEPLNSRYSGGGGRVERDDGGERGVNNSRRVSQTVRTGDAIEARYRGGSKWYDGVVKKTHSDGTFDIRYVDGDEERGVEARFVRLADDFHDKTASGNAEANVHSPSRSRGRRDHEGGNYCVGDKVEARFNGRARWFSATVERINHDGTYHLLYVDGDEERAVGKDLIRSRNGSSTSATGAERETRSGSRSPGRRVISGAGGSESDLSVAHTTFREGDKVEARYKRGRKWYQGVVLKIGRDGTCDIRYDDGDIENAVDPGHVRAAGVGSTESLALAGRERTSRRTEESDYVDGDKVEARFGGRSRWLKATVQRKNRDGTYHLFYIDGEEERAVEKALIRRVSGVKPEERTGLDTSNKKHRVGDDIEARYKRGRKWYPGAIRTVNRDGTYDIRYSDGDTERDVESALVRSKGSTTLDYLDSGGRDAARVKTGFDIGDNVEARFGGRSRWFKATVERVNRDGTYHLLYVDGDEERAVEKDLIRNVSDGGPVRSPTGRTRDGMAESDLDRKYRVGDDIEARYRRGKKWYPGVIRAVNRNGTYNVRYKDGDEESDVESSFVRHTGRASADSLASSTGVAVDDSTRDRDFTAGATVEARYRGRSRWLKARIERKNRDGTYYLVYVDGDEERAVEKEFIRLPAAKRPSIRDAARRTASGTMSTLDTPLRVGDTIEARYKRGSKWYPGVVHAANRGGTYDIRYSGGDTEYDVDASMVRSASALTLSSTEADEKYADNYREGDSVEAKFGGRSRWYKAKVSRKNRDGTYHLIYADGDEERAVDKSMIRRIGADRAQDIKGSSSRTDVNMTPNIDSGAESGRSKKLRVGAEIEARYKKGGRWYPGVIRAVNRDGTYDIRYQDGGAERDVDPSLVRSKGGQSLSSLESADNGEGFLEGDKVEARFGGRSRWFKATIQRKNRDGTYFLRYIDGDEERSVEKDLIRRIEPPSGDRAVQSRSRSPGRRVVSGAASDAESTVKTYLVGDEIEARYKRGRKWYPGTIRGVNRDGSYDIRYNDGDTERDVDPGLVRGMGTVSANSLATASSTAGGGVTLHSDSSSFGPGDKVEARFGGRSRWFKATVEKENRDGTYHLLYVDGDEERKVTKDLIRKIDGGGCDSGSRSGSKSPGRRVILEAAGDSDVDRSRRASLRVGDEVEGRQGRGRTWVPGRIRAINHNGTYDVRYDDGDLEKSVNPELVRGRGADSRLGRDVENRADFKVGERVEARFGGRSRWFKATVERRNRDGTFHLLYIDGDEERTVERDLIRKLEPTRLTRGKADSLDSLASVNDPVRYRSGDRVEARFGGRSRWFKAIVERENRNGTYHLLYDDGDEEREVDKDLIRGLEDQASRSGGASGARKPSPSSGNRGSGSKSKLYRVGDDIEARYKGGRKWFPGVVRGVNDDDTYDIRYNDGDSERNVERGLVRAANGASVDFHSSAVDDGVGEYATGDRVEARFGGRSRWFKATVERKNRDGTYHLVYADGDEERNVESSLIRRRDEGDQPRSRSIGRRKSSPGGDSSGEERGRSATGHDVERRSPRIDKALLVGDNVEVRFAGGARWFPGRVGRIHRDGSYDITYADGEKETYVPGKFVRQVVSRSSDSGGSGDNARRPERGGHNTHEKERGHLIIAGDPVEARLRGRSTWHRGEVTRVHSDGTYDIRYQDSGEHEKRVDPGFVRHLLAGSRSRGASRSRPRDSVGARDSSMSESDRQRRGQRGRSRERRRSNQNNSSWWEEDARAAAVIVAAGLRKARKSLDHLTRKLERRRGLGAIARGVECDSLGAVLADLGVNLNSREMRAIAHHCQDEDLVGCIDTSALASLIKERWTGDRSAAKRARSSLRKPHQGGARSTSGHSRGLPASEGRIDGSDGSRTSSARDRRGTRSGTSSRGRRRHGSTSSSGGGGSCSSGSDHQVK